jgi:membrane-bound metal-dependent hydrolase YbcI (DUF457 family)
MQRKNLSSAYIGTITHYAAHITSALAIASIVAPPSITYLVSVIIGAIIPDIDSDIGLPHRAHTHSLLSVAALVVLTYTDAPAADNSTLGIAIGWVAHILLDLLHGGGVMLLYPLRTYLSIAQLPLQSVTIISTLGLAVGFSSHPAYPAIPSTLPSILAAPVTAIMSVMPPTSLPPTPTSAITYHIPDPYRSISTPATLPPLPTYRPMLSPMHTPTTIAYDCIVNQWGITECNLPPRQNSKTP